VANDTNCYEALRPFYNLYENVNVGVDSMEEHMKEEDMIFFNEWRKDSRLKNKRVGVLKIKLQY